MYPDRGLAAGDAVVLSGRILYFDVFVRQYVVTSKATVMTDEAMPPKGQPVVRAVAMPKDTNPHGDIFGGWILSQMDIAGGVTAGQCARGRIATVGIEAMSFHKPVKVGDVLCCHTEVTHIGSTSIAVRIEAWALRGGDWMHAVKVTEGMFTYVALDAEGRKRPVLPL